MHLRQSVPTGPLASTLCPNRAGRATPCRALTAVDRTQRLRCPHAERCGGCSLWELDYGAQLEHKAGAAERALTRYPALETVPLAAIVPAPTMERYRVREKLVIEGQRLGLYARGSHEVVDIPECQLSSPALERVVRAVRRRLPFDFPVFGIDVREVDAGALLTLIVPERVDAERLRAIAAELCRDEPSIVGVSASRRAERSPRLLGAAPETLAGLSLAPHHLDPAWPYQLAAPGSFVQAHPAQATRLYAAVEAALSARLGGLAGKRLLELFAGSGALALRLASLGAAVTAIDSHAPGIAALSAAARAQGIPLSARAARAESSMTPGADGFDAVIVDPPRRGLAPELRRQLAGARPRLIAYVSCEPHTLARDLSHLAELGYRPSQITPFDLLPLSDSVELLALLEPAPPPEPRLLHRDERLLAIEAPAFADGLQRAVQQRFTGALSLDDESASGVRLFAASKESRDALFAALRNASARGPLEYSVLVRGITRHHGRLRGGDYARTRVVGTHSLLSVRAQPGKVATWSRDLSRIGHPVLGDTRHGDPKSNRHFSERHGLDRSFVHVARVELSEPALTLGAPLAPDLEAVLESLSGGDDG
jgi:23S rRNA (uracil1939-C5)-methyltransferase